MSETDRDLLKKVLTGQVLTLAAAMRAAWLAKNSGIPGSFVPEAVAAIRKEQGQIVDALLAPADRQ